MGLNSSLSSLPQSRSVKGGGGGGGGGGKVDSDGSIPVNRMMIFDHSLKGVLTSRSTQAERRNCHYL